VTDQPTVAPPASVSNVAPSKGDRHFFVVDSIEGACLDIGGSLHCFPWAVVRHAVSARSSSRGNNDSRDPPQFSAL
jgi:hypothetical protein